METLPIRANNPFALIQKKGAASPWKGLTGQTENGFLIFDNAENGARAGFISLFNTYLKKGINQYGIIIPIYAPKPKNNPVEYIDFIKRYTNISPVTKLDSMDKIIKVSKAIIKQESGKDWIPESMLIRAYKSAQQVVNLPKAESDGIYKFFTFMAVLWAIKIIS